MMQATMQLSVAGATVQAQFASCLSYRLLLVFQTDADSAAFYFSY
jgi:hypothetical protein